MPKDRKITVAVVVNAPKDFVWSAFTDPESVTGWNFASEDWCCPKATNDLRVDGVFNYRMEAKDGSMGFDFLGRYTEVVDRERIRYRLGDDREVEIEFMNENGKTKVTEHFDPEHENSDELQRKGWQAILDNFKGYTEGKYR